MTAAARDELSALLAEIAACRVCADSLPLGPRPVLQAGADARVLIIGQAPGIRVHQSGVPWDDASGKRLRAWMGVDEAVFYDPQQVALMPTGFCYPGKGASGDLPPRPECAPLWHDRLLALLPRVDTTLIIGRYAMARYLDAANLTEAARRWRDYAPERWPLPHPSPRNRHWPRANPWFEAEVLPALQRRIAATLAGR